MHHLRKEKVWRAVGYADTPQGRVKVARKRKLQGDAIKARDKAIEDLEGRRGIEADTPLADYLRDWLQYTARANVARNTYERYEQVIRLDLIPLLGAIQLAELSAADVRYLKQSLLDSGKAPATVAYVQGVLSNALNQAVSDGLIASNPSSKVRKARERSEKMRPLSAEQAGKLVEVARETRYEALYLLALKLGPRQGELLALFWEDFDLERGTLTITRSVDTHQAGSRWGATKTGAGRTVRLPESVEVALREHVRRQKVARLAAREWEDLRLVFPNGSGRVLRRTQLMHDFHKHLSMAGLPRIRFHDLRHTAATLMLRQGVPVPTVSQILGHKNATQTLNRYSHVLSDMQDSAAARMDEVGF